MVISKELYKNMTFQFMAILITFFSFLLLELIVLGSISFKYIEIFIATAISINITSFLAVSQKQYYQKFVVLFFSFIGVLAIKIITQENMNGEDIKYLLAFYTGITNLYLILLFIFNNKFKINKTINYVCLFFLFLPTIFIYEYFFISGNFISTDTILALFQTNISETKSYIDTFIGVWQYIGLLILFLLLFLIVKFSNNLKFHNINIKILVILIISLLCNAFLVYRYKTNLLSEIFFDTKQALADFKDFKDNVASRKVADIKPDNVNNINGGIYVLVIGESQNKKHMSAYGYDKKTTPWLDGMETNDNFIKFTNVYSCHTQTVPVLTYALTSKNQYNNIALQNAISVLDVAKACNIKTAWLSNQVHYGGYDTPVSVIADTAQQQKWINNNIGLTTRTKYYDIKLIDELNKIKIYDNMLIVIHLMGNHGSYGDRYPKKYNVFGEKNKHTKYDNSIFYNDYVVKNIYETVKNFSNFKVLLYCSDHSEAVDQNLGHDASQFVPDMTYIPMYLYVSDSYKKDNINIFNNLYKNKDSYFTNDLLFNLILGILNIKISDIYEKDNDITGTNYNNNFNRFKTLHGKKNIKKI